MHTPNSERSRAKWRGAKSKRKWVNKGKTKISKSYMVCRHHRGGREPVAVKSRRSRSRGQIQNENFWFVCLNLVIKVNKFGDLMARGADEACLNKCQEHNSIFRLVFSLFVWVCVCGIVSVYKCVGAHAQPSAHTYYTMYVYSFAASYFFLWYLYGISSLFLVACLMLIWKSRQPLEISPFAFFFSGA